MAASPEFPVQAWLSSLPQCLHLIPEHPHKVMILKPCPVCAAPMRQLQPRALHKKLVALFFTRHSDTCHNCSSQRLPKVQNESHLAETLPVLLILEDLSPEKQREPLLDPEMVLVPMIPDRTPKRRFWFFSRRR